MLRRDERQCRQSAQCRQYGHSVRPKLHPDTVRFPFARDEIAAEASENVETLTISDVNLADLSWARAEGTVQNLADRRFDLYRIEWDKRVGQVSTPIGEAGEGRATAPGGRYAPGGG